MIDYLAIRQALETALADELGTYTFPDGQITPAMAVVVGKNNYPQSATPSGLECVVVVDLGVGIRNLLGGDYEKTWRADIVLKQWDISDDAKDCIDYLPLVEEAIAQLDNIAIQPNSIKGLASDKNLQAIQMLQLTVFHVELYEPG